MALVNRSGSDSLTDINPVYALHTPEDWDHSILVWTANVLCSPYYYVELLFQQVAGLFVEVKDTNSAWVRSNEKY